MKETTNTGADRPNEMTASRAPRVRRVSVAFLTLAMIASSLFIGTAPAGAIVNGVRAELTPWQVSVQDAEGHFCGGSIIDANTIVTAAHCLEGYDASEIRIRAGVLKLSSRGGQTRQADSLISHPRYARDELADIGIIKLASPLRLTRRVAVIAPATIAEINAVTSASVTGWGAISENGRGSNRLREAEVPLVSDRACNRMLGTDAATELCAGGTGTDSCYGDSGGPLVVETNDGPRLAGIVSWGARCGGRTPGVYAEVPTFVDFIAAGQASNSNRSAYEGDFARVRS